MSRFFVAVLGTAMLVMVGCQRGQDNSGGDGQMMSNDACSMCPGVQKATSDGKCDSCGMAVKGGGAKHMSADACAKCPGVQMASTDGKCEMCEAKKMSGGSTTRPAQ